MNIYYTGRLYLETDNKLLNQIYLTRNTLYIEFMSCAYASVLIRSLYIIVLHNQLRWRLSRTSPCFCHVDSQTLNAITCIRKEGDEREMVN